MEATVEMFLFYPHGNVMDHWFVAWPLISWFTTWSLAKKTLSTLIVFWLHVISLVMEQIPSLPVLLRCDQDAIIEKYEMSHVSKADVYALFYIISITQMLFYLVTAWSICSCICARALDKDKREGWREQERKKRQRESSAQISECVWQRGQPRRQVPALQHRKWHMTALTFVIPLSPSAPKPKPPTNTQASIDTHTLEDTQSHTVYCLDYIIFIPGTWALLVGWHLGLCSTKVTFLCPWVKDACLQHAFEMKDRKKIRWERFPKALWSEASTVTHKLVKQYVNLGWYWIKLPEWHESIVLRWSK